MLTARGLQYLKKLEEKGTDIICRDEWGETHTDLERIGYIVEVHPKVCSDDKLVDLFNFMSIFNPTLIELTPEGKDAIKEFS